MLNDYQDVFTNKNCHVGKTHGLHSRLSSCPIRDRYVKEYDHQPLPLSAKIKNKLGTEFMMKSPWSSPSVPETKKSGAVRWCVWLSPGQKSNGQGQYQVCSCCNFLISILHFYVIRTSSNGSVLSLSRDTDGYHVTSILH